MTSEDKLGSDLADLAEKAAEDLLKDNPSLKTASLTDRGIVISMAIHNQQGSTAELGTAVRKDLSFGVLRKGWIQQGGGHGMVLQDHVIPHILIRSVIDGLPLSSIIDEMRSFAKSQTSVTERYVPLSGVTVVEVVSLGPNIDLIPWTDVPDSDQKAIFGADSHQERIWPMAQWRSIATAAIRILSPECQVLFESHDESKTARDTSVQELKAQTELDQDIIRCITALNICPVAAIGGWSQFSKTIANEFIGSSYSFGPELNDISISRASLNPVVLDGKSVSGLLSNFQRLNPSEGAVIRVALDRLNQAIRQGNIVNKAIDLGIALEVILLHEIDDTYRGELKFRSSVRGSAFLGGNKDERIKTFKLLKEAYDLRSKAVHSGVLKENKNNPVQLLKDATDICASIALKLIDSGSFPNWDPDYVIGGEA